MVKTSQEMEQFREIVLKWSEENFREFAWRETSDPFEVLVAEILLQRTDSRKVESAYRELLDEYPDLDALSEADVNNVASILEPLGLHNKRSEALVQIAERLQHRGIPATEDELLDLPLVGRYCANATLCFAFDQDCAIVDRNVVRIYERFFDRELDYQSGETWEFAEEVLPEEDVQKFNLALLDFAAEICVDGTPRCSVCPLSGNCSYYS